MFSVTIRNSHASAMIVFAKMQDAVSNTYIYALPGFKGKRSCKSEKISAFMCTLLADSVHNSLKNL